MRAHGGSDVDANPAGCELDAATPRGRERGPGGLTREARHARCEDRAAGVPRRDGEASHVSVAVLSPRG